ncbi:MAG: nucleoid occlusion protein [Liquorilactobacillus nagelii]|uniref:nucleoid occlusion protein n=1 Tax=Liquorilactobacillus nagelii TaxID=82688 RepID=UPI00242BEC62|nr:nucleoid occlusion protein [Liquorilactobacillus nagelii]MCI1633862.1 nucleoid occlusion protein [Liquorilactobacillus nagelii]
MAFSFWKNKQETAAPMAAAQVQQIPTAQIIANHYQPRQVFDQEKIAELAATLQEHGMLQPIILRSAAAKEEQQYEIIAGERRFRAALQLKWDKVPAIIKEMSDTEAASFAVIENLQREGLTAIEEAQAYQELMELNQLNQSQLAKEIGKSQSFVANKLRLLKLAPFVKQALLTRKISERHGRSVVGLSVEDQSKIIQQTIDQQLTVKETENLVKSQVTTSAQDKVSKKKPQHKLAKGKTQDLRVAVNTIKQSLKLISDSGIKVTTHEEQGPDYHRIIIDLPLETEK